jgi:citrate lyase subunit beta/citryl-CoA lyase
MTFENPGPAWIFCPADRPERFAKAAAVADVVILDLEDGVSADRKEDARAALQSTPLDPARTVIRVNGGALTELDLQTLSRTDYTTVMLPKYESIDQARQLPGLTAIVIVETPRGALTIADTVAADNVAGVMWGAEDLFAAMGGTANRWPDGTYRTVAEHVRSSSLLAAKAYGRLSLDSVFVDIADLDGLRREAEDAAAVGFDVKVALHPTQVAVIRASYTPHPEQVEWARRALDAAPNNRGAFALDGKMIDAPLLRRAEEILRLANWDQPS